MVSRLVGVIVGGVAVEMRLSGLCQLVQLRRIRL